MPEPPITLPWEDRAARPGRFVPPEAFAKVRDECPLRPMTFADGHVGWLATGYDVVRTVLADDRFSVRREIAHVPFRLPNAQEQDVLSAPASPGMFVRMDPPDHTRYRRLLAGAFTARRMNRLAVRIAEVTRDRLDGMERTGPPADLVQALAVPVPSMVICELLGIPSSDRGGFQEAVDTAIDAKATPEDVQRAFATVLDVFPPLIESKRGAPADDIFSGLVNDGGLTDEELVNIGLLLFAGGFETTATMLAMGTFALLQHPDQLGALRRDPALIDNAAEELLRYLTGPGGMVRTALEDVEIAGELIRQGQTVELIPAAANHDPARFDDPGRFDITRSTQRAGAEDQGGRRHPGHLTFGHGVHQCIGQQLARAEMRVVFPALFDRFPDLRLAVPAEEVPMKDESVFYGPKRLPVAW